MARRTVITTTSTTPSMSADEIIAQIPIQTSTLDDDSAVTQDAEDRAEDKAEDKAEDVDEPGDPQEEEAVHTLDDDPDTSLVGSIYLHLLSEHTCYEALRLSDDDAIALHQREHKEHPQNHSISDWRFRPGRALAASMRGAETPTEPPV